MNHPGFKELQAVEFKFHAQTASPSAGSYIHPSKIFINLHPLFV